MDAIREWLVIERMMVGDFNPDPDFIQGPDGKMKGSRPKKGSYVLRHTKDVTAEFINDARPGIGVVEYDPGFMAEENIDEVEFGEWVHSALGGQLKHKAISLEEGVKTPDYEWNGRFWELKTASTEASLDSSIRYGLKQIENNPGGIFINFGNHDFSLDEALKYAERRLYRSAAFPVDIVIVSKGKVVKVLRKN